MKKKRTVMIIAAILVVALGVTGAILLFSSSSSTDADLTDYASGEYTVSYGAQGSGSALCEAYSGKKGDGVKLTADVKEVRFFKWEITGEYEIIAGGNVNTKIIIKPLSDIKAVAVFYDAEGTESSRFWIVVSSLNNGFLNTLRLFILTLLGAIPLGLIISFGSMSRLKVISVPVRVLVWIVRGSPLMLQLLIIYYMPSMMFGVVLWGGSDTGRFWAAVVAFVINYACYFSEIFRGGIQGVPIGQHEAGQVLGLSKSQIFFRVTLMQMIKRIVPPMSNEIITLVKDTSLAQIIAMKELIWMGNDFLNGSNGISGIVWPLFFTGVYYLAFSGILTLLFGWVEKKLSYFKV